MSLPNAPTESRRLTRRLRGINPAVLIGQVTVALAAFAVVIGLTCLLSNDSKPPLRQVTFASAGDWPEIKNGVPELNSREVSTKAPPDRLPAAFETRPIASHKPENASHGLIHAGLTESAPSDGITHGSNGFRTQNETPSSASTSSANASSAAQSHLVDRGEQAISSSMDPRDSRAPASATNDGSRAQAEAHTTGGRGLAANEPQPENSAAAAPVSVTDTRIGKRKMEVERDQTGSVRPERSGAKAQHVRATAGQLSSPVKPRPVTDKAEPKPRNARHADSKHPRTAAAQPQARPATSPATAEVAPAPVPSAADKERVHLLGIPMPTGREVKECLLEFRC